MPDPLFSWHFHYLSESQFFSVSGNKFIDFFIDPLCPILLFIIDKLFFIVVDNGADQFLNKCCLFFLKHLAYVFLNFCFVVIHLLLHSIFYFLDYKSSKL